MASVDIRISLLPPVGRIPLHAILRFTDGRVLEFDESLATDLGDYDDGYVHQKCLRQVQDDFLVDFRPDAVGRPARDEVVLEYGSLHRFAATAPSHPATASGNAPSHIMVPQAPVLYAVPGGPSTQKGNVQIIVSQITPDGESAGSYAWINLTAGDRPVVKAPTPLPGATGYLVRNGPYLQTSLAVPIDQDWTSPSDGLIAKGTQNYPAPRTIAARVTISGGSLAGPAEFVIPVWYWRTRCRWMTAPRPCLFSAADLVAQKLVAPLNGQFAYTASLKSSALSWSPMSSGGIETAMGTTGDRAEIGWETEYMARWRLTGDPTSEQRWRAAAEATGTVPWWVRDVATGAVVDLRARKYPAFNDSDQMYSYDRIPSAPSNVAATNFFVPDLAHMPEMAALAFAITRDPYYLEGAQMQCAYDTMESNLYRKANNNPTLATGQARGHAWADRDAFLLSMATPDTVPGWLLPRAYYRDVMAAKLSYNTLYLSNPARVCSVFGMLPETHWWMAFQHLYVCFAAGMIYNSGQYPEWGDCMKYVTRLLVQMAHPQDKYGWDHRNQGTYYSPINDARKGASATGGMNLRQRAVDSPDTPADLAELHQLMPAIITGAAWTGTNWVDPTTLVGDVLAKPHNGYLPWVRAALAVAARAGIADALAGHDWLAAQLARVTSPPTSGSVKFAVAPPPSI